MKPIYTNDLLIFLIKFRYGEAVAEFFCRKMPGIMQIGVEYYKK